MSDERAGRRLRRRGTATAQTTDADCAGELRSGEGSCFDVKRTFGAQGNISDMRISGGEELV